MNKYPLDFIEAVEYTLKHEGGYVNHPDDPGGATNFGITFKTLSAYRKNPNLTIDDVKNLTREEAIEIYYSEYWKKRPYAGITYMPLRVKCFDWAVNMGHTQTARSLQKSCNTMITLVNKKNENNPAYIKPLLAEDGIFGPATLAIVNSYRGEDLLNYMIEEITTKVRPAMYKNKPNLETFSKNFQKRDTARPR
jgi:lysozyme family protein